MSEINKVHDTLIDLLCSVMKYIPYENPEIGDWCYEMTSAKEQNRDWRTGVRKKIFSEGEYLTVTVSGKEIHWYNAEMKKIPSDWMRDIIK